MKIMKLRTLLLGAVGALTLALAPRTTDAQAQYVMNIGTVAPDGTPWADQLKDLKKRIEKESAGRIKVKMFLGGALGSEIEMIQDVARGERLQGGGFSTGAIGEGLDIPVLMMPELPYLFRSVEEADVILDEVLYEPTNAALGKKGMVLAAWAENGWRSFATKGGPATSPTELAKYKMRSQEAPVHLNMYKALGVQAVAKPVSEVLPALNTGIVDGFDNTPLFSLASGWIGPATHYTLSKHIYQPAAVVYSKKFVDSLPDDLKKIVMGDPAGESKRGRVAVRTLEADLLSTIEGMGKEIVKLTPEQNKAFRQKCRSTVHKQFLGEHQEMQALYGKVTSKLKTLR